MGRHADPPGVEWVDPGEPTEVLDTAPPRRRWLRWTPLVALAAAGLAVGASVAGTSSDKAASRPPSVPSPPRVARAAPTAVSPIQAIGGLPAQAVAVRGQEIWVLQDSAIVRFHDLGASGTRPVTSPLHTDPDSQPMLLVNGESGQLWIVLEHGGTGQVLQLSADTLRREQTVDTSSIAGAALLERRLYIITRRSLIEVDHGTAHVRARAPSGGFFSIAADAMHGRLLLASGGWPTRLWAYRPGGHLTVASPPLPLGKASLAVVAGQMWLGGFGNRGPVFERWFDGRARRSPLADQLGPGGVIVGSGHNVVWVRAGEADDNSVWCVDASTGRALQRWNVDGQIASTTQTALVANGSGLHRLRHTSCPG